MGERAALSTDSATGKTPKGLTANSGGVDTG